MTPPARWRPSLPAGAFILGPAICQGCGDPVWFGRSMTRVQGKVVLGEVKAWRQWGALRVHSHAPVKGIRRVLPRKPYDPDRHPMLANARAEWDNRRAGTSSEPDTMRSTPHLPLVPVGAASSRSEGRD